MPGRANGGCSVQSMKGVPLRAFLATSLVLLALPPPPIPFGPFVRSKQLHARQTLLGQVAVAHGRLVSVGHDPGLTTAPRPHRCPNGLTDSQPAGRCGILQKISRPPVRCS